MYQPITLEQRLLIREFLCKNYNMTRSHASDFIEKLLDFESDYIYTIYYDGKEIGNV